jgi:hypothetical protein
MFIDQYSAQRYTVFAAFVNLYLQTGNLFTSSARKFSSSLKRPAPLAPNERNKNLT